MKIEYGCSICGKKNVKLWRPYGDSAPLICAECAEERQSPMEYTELIWKKDEGYDDRWIGTPNKDKKKLPLPKWKVDEMGRVPTYDGPGPEGLPPTMTDQLIVDLCDVSKAYSSGRTTMIPACPDEDGNFWCYTVVPEDVCKWWNELPTR